MMTILAIFILLKVLEMRIGALLETSHRLTTIVLCVTLLYAIYSHDAGLFLEVTYIWLTAIYDDTFTGQVYMHHYTKLGD